MSVSSVTINGSFCTDQNRPSAVASSTNGASYASIAASQGNGTPYSDAEIKGFFSTNPNEDQIAGKAAALGLNNAQILSAMKTAGLGESDQATLQKRIDGFMASHSGAYQWGNDGRIVDTSKSSAASIAPLDLSKETVNGLTTQSATWTTQGVSISDQANRMRAAGVDGLTLNKFLYENRVKPQADQYPTGLTGVVDKSGKNMSLADVKAFFATNPSNEAMYKAWSDLGLNDNQMQHLMAIKYGTQYVPTMVTGQFDSAGNYADPYYGSDAFTGGGTVNGTPTGNRYGDSNTKPGAWTPPAGWGTATGAIKNSFASAGSTLNAKA